MLVRGIIITLCAICLSLGGQAHGATFGYTTVGAFTKNLENQRYLTRFTLGSDGVADSITAYLGNTFAAKKGRFFLYRVTTTAADDSIRLVAATDEIALSVATGWVSAPLNPKPLLIAGDYYIGASSSAGAGLCNLYFDGGTGAKAAHRNLGSFDSTAFYNLTSFTWNSDSSHSIYCTYTPSTDGVMGDTLLGQSDLSCEGTINGGVWQTPAKAIIIDSAAWWVNLSTHSATSHFRAMSAGLYLEADSSRLDYSDSVSIQLNGNGDRYRVFRFNLKPTISASTNIFPSIWADTSYATIATRVVTLSGNGLYTRTYSWFNNGPGTWPDPMGAAKAANYKVHCLLYYHDAPAATGIKPRRRRIIESMQGWIDWQLVPNSLVRETRKCFAGDDIAIPL